MHHAKARMHIPPNTMPTMAPVGKTSSAKLGVPIGLIAVVVSITVALLEFILLWLLLGALVYFSHAALDIIYIRFASAIT